MMNEHENVLTDLRINVLASAYTRSVEFPTRYILDSVPFARAIEAEVRAALSQPSPASEPTIKYVPINTNDYKRHPNDKTVTDPACIAALNLMGDDKGQGLAPYWKWGFHEGFDAGKRAAQPSPAVPVDQGAPIGFARAMDLPVHKDKGTLIFRTPDGDWNVPVYHSPAAHAAPQPTETAQPALTYSSTQATTCAGCGERKHTPLRIDAMGGYVCLTCIDKKLGSLLGEFGAVEPAQPATQAGAGEPVPPFPADFPHYELRFIMRVLSNEGSAPREDWKTARGMAQRIYEQWHAHCRAQDTTPSTQRTEGGGTP